MTALVDQKRFQIILRLIILRKWRNTDIPWKSNEKGELIRDESGEQVLDFFPTNITDFCNWLPGANSLSERSKTYSEGDLAGFLGAPRAAKLDAWPDIIVGSLQNLETLSRTTVNQTWHAPLKAVINRELKLIKSKARTQLEKKNKVTVIEAQKDDLAHLRKIVAEQEVESRASRAAERKAIKELADEKALHARNVTEAKAEIERLKARISELLKAQKVVANLVQGEQK